MATPTRSMMRAVPHTGTQKHRRRRITNMAHLLRSTMATIVAHHLRTPRNLLAATIVVHHQRRLLPGTLLQAVAILLLLGISDLRITIRHHLPMQVILHHLAARMHHLVGNLRLRVGLIRGLIHGAIHVHNLRLRTVGIMIQPCMVITARHRQVITAIHRQVMEGHLLILDMGHRHQVMVMDIRRQGMAIRLSSGAGNVLREEPRSVISPWLGKLHRGERVVKTKEARVKKVKRKEAAKEAASQRALLEKTTMTDQGASCKSGCVSILIAQQFGWTGLTQSVG